MTIGLREGAAVAVGNSSVSSSAGIGELVASAVVNTDSSDTWDSAHLHGTGSDARTYCCTSMRLNIDNAAYFRRS